MKQLLPSTVVIIWDIMYLMWIWEMIMCLSTELQGETFHCLMVGEEMGSHTFSCSTEGCSLALVPSWCVSEGLEMGIHSPWASAERQSSSAAPLPTVLEHISCARAWQTDEDLWDLSQLFLGKDDACDFITLYTFTTHLLLCPAFLEASLSEWELQTALGATGFSLTHHNVTVKKILLF